MNFHSPGGLQRSTRNIGLSSCRFWMWRVAAGDRGTPGRSVWTVRVPRQTPMAISESGCALRVCQRRVLPLRLWPLFECLRVAGEHPTAPGTGVVVVNDRERVVALGGRLVDRDDARATLDALRETASAHDGLAAQTTNQSSGEFVRNSSGKARWRHRFLRKLLELRLGDWSERRDSNPRHSRWQRDALPG